VILDESDNISGPAQDALRGVIEEFSANARFILTANYLPKIKPAIQSRFTVIDFGSSNEKSKLMAAMFKRCKEILESENVSVENPQVLVELIVKHYPDFRKVLNVLQSSTSSGKLDATALVDEHKDIDEVVSYVTGREWTKMRQWVGEHNSIDPVPFLRHLWDVLEQKVDKSKLPGIVLIIADYTYKSAFTADREILMTAALTEIMAHIGA
jgi:DNA polymerase III delta prime subunit